MKLRQSSGVEMLTQTAEPCGIMNEYFVLYRHWMRLVCCCWAVHCFTTLPWGHCFTIAMVAGIWSCESIHACVCQWTRLHVSIMLWAAAEAFVQVSVRLHSWTYTLTSYLEGYRFYFLADHWDVVLFIAVQCTEAQKLSSQTHMYSY